MSWQMDINITYFTLLIWKARKATQISHISKNKIYFISYHQNEAAIAILDEKLPVFERSLSNVEGNDLASSLLIYHPPTNLHFLRVWLLSPSISFLYYIRDKPKHQNNDFYLFLTIFFTLETTPLRFYEVFIVAPYSL